MSIYFCFQFYLLFIGVAGGRLQDDGTDYRAFCDQTNEVCSIKIDIEKSNYCLLDHK